MFNKKIKTIFIEEKGVYVNFPVPEIKDSMIRPEVPSGIYKVKDVGGPGAFIWEYTPYSQNNKKLIQFKNGIVSDIITHAMNFFSPETKQKYRKLGIVYKDCILLHGPAGTGKTCTAEVVANTILQSFPCITIIANGKSVIGIKRIVDNLNDNGSLPVIVIYDEVEELFTKDADSNTLTFLDGMDTPENMFFIGITNFINKIDKRITERKSRVSRIYQIDKLPETVVREYVAKILEDFPDVDREKIVHYCVEGNLIIDEVKHAIINHIIHGEDIVEAVKTASTYAKGALELQP